MAWLYLILAGLCEVGWPLGFKLANLNPRYHLLFLVLAVVSMGMSGWLLYIAQKTIPMYSRIADNRMYADRGRSRRRK